MAKLADVDSEVRIILKVLAAALGIFVVLFIFFKGGTFIKNTLFPTPPPPPAEKFGKLSRVDFPAQEPVKDVEYRINTLSGQLPVLSDRMNIYKIKKNPPSLVALQAAKNQVAAHDFSQNETKLSETVFQWDNSRGAQIQYNIVTKNFKILTNFLNEPPPLYFAGTVTTKDGAYEFTLSYLQKMGEDNSDIDQSRSTATYLKLDNGQLVGVASQSEAQFLRLALFQNDLDKLKIYYPEYNSSNMNFTYKSADEGPVIVNGNYVHLIPNPDESSTYPIKTAEQAFEDLKKGNALIFKQSPNSIIDITDVSLGYYLGDETQEYTVPIIIFSGKDFLAYVQALADSSISN